MNTYVNILTATHSDYYFAQLQFDADTLVLKIDQGFKRALKKKIPLEFVENLQADFYLGAKTVRFTINETQYTFFEFGESVIDYLQEKLMLN